MSTPGIEDEQLAEVRSMIEDLILDCPFDHSNPETCPLHGLREEPVADRMRGIEALPVPVLDDLLVYHWVCLEEKLESVARV